MAGLTLEKVNRLVSDQIARQILRCVHTAHNQCAVEIGAFPQFDETGLLLRLLEFDCATHHSDCSSGIISCTRASKSFDSLLGLGQTALSDEPPGRFRRDEEKDGEGSRKHPLQCNGNSGTTVSTALLDGIYGGGRTCTQTGLSWIGSGR